MSVPELSPSKRVELNTGNW